MSTDLEVDDSSKCLIASWFGIDSSQNKNTENGDDPVFSSEKKSSKKKRKENESKEKKHEVNNVSESDQNLQVFTSGLPQKKTMSNFVGEKLQKKLTKLKHRKDNAEKDIEINKKTSVDPESKTALKRKKKKKQVEHIGSDDDDDCSKVKVVKKTKKEVLVAMPTVEGLKKSLNEDKNLSKNQRKRLKKKLNKLIQNDEKGTAKMKESIGSGNAKTEKDDTKVNTKNDAKDKASDLSQNSSDSGKNNVKKKKRKKKTKENLNDTTVSDISNISITNDIAVIESPKKKIKTNHSAKDCVVLTNTDTKQGKKKKKLTEKRDKSGESNNLYNGSMGKTGEVTHKDRKGKTGEVIHNDRKGEKSKKTSNGAFVSVESTSSEGSFSEKESSVSENTDSGVKSKHKKKKLKHDENLKTKLKLEEADHMNVKNKHRKIKILKDKSQIDKNSDKDDCNDNNDNADFTVNNNVVKKKHKLSDSISEASSPKKRNIETDHSKSITEGSTSEGDIPRRRKRHKTRSKQKNIKKDHRPEHMKPAYLQQSTKQEKKDDD